jgi:acyl-CoA synthetase (AMP-forming)/AMP-acid ligase II
MQRGLLQESLVAAASSAPGRDAVVDEFGRQTYAEFLDQALRFARLLQDQGFQSGDRVAL